MRELTKDITFDVDGVSTSFRISKLDAFSGVSLLRLLMRTEERVKNPTMLDLVSCLSDDELKGVMTSVLNHVYVLLPAGPNPVMTGPEWGYPELKYNTPACMKLLLEGIAWSLQGFFGEGGLKRQSAPSDT